MNTEMNTNNKIYAYVWCEEIFLTLNSYAIYLFIYIVHAYFFCMSAVRLIILIFCLTTI